MRPTTMKLMSSAAFAVALTLPLAAWAQSSVPVGNPAPTVNESTRVTNNGSVPTVNESTPPRMAAVTTTTTTTTTDAMAGGREERVEQRIADMHATLQITPPEEAVFNQFAQVMLDNAQTMDQAFSENTAKIASRSAEQNLQAYADTAEQHAMNVKKLSVAFGSLYAALTPQQQQIADDMFRTAAVDRAQKADQKAGG